jgi:hypothetical protein
MRLSFRSRHGEFNHGAQPQDALRAQVAREGRYGIASFNVSVGTLDRKSGARRSVRVAAAVPGPHGAALRESASFRRIPPCLFTIAYGAFSVSTLAFRIPQCKAVIFALCTSAMAVSAHAQEAPAERASVQAVADSALAAISRGDVVGFTDLMVPEAVLFPTQTRDGVTRYRPRTRAEQRAQPFGAKITERGFTPDVRINGGVAVVWYPYDLYVNDAWSHCGVDVFTLIRTQTGWRIATMTWSAEQPPVCAKHPDGPPKAGDK